MTPVADLLRWLDARGLREGRVVADSRAVREGDLFLAMPGVRSDGRAYAAAAVAAGARAVIWEAEAWQQPDLKAPNLGVYGLQKRSGELAHQLAGRPSEALRVIGVTGTNGKTTVTHFVAQAMAVLGKRCGVIGTLGFGFPGQLAAQANTTPDAVSVHAALAEMLQAGAEAVAMEVSSIGLVAGRVDGVRFDTAVFTNLSRDHLDYHGDMAAYAAAKRTLFARPELRVALACVDDAAGFDMLAATQGERWACLLKEKVESKVEAGHGIVVENLVFADTGVELRLKVDGQHCQARWPVLGRYNVSNMLLALGVLLTGGVPLADAVAALERVVPPVGRLEQFGGEGCPLVVIDYAHTPDALAKVLAALREISDKRGGSLWVVFGCGGNRDAGKRPQMGCVAEHAADVVLLTSDNPRDEAPEAILDAISSGMGVAARQVEDRAQAIRTAIADASASDVILIAGKGHENYQEIGGIRLPFSDQQVAQAALQEYWRQAA